MYYIIHIYFCTWSAIEHAPAVTYATTSANGTRHMTFLHIPAHRTRRVTVCCGRIHVIFFSKLFFSRYCFTIRTTLFDISMSPPPPLRGLRDKLHAHHSGFRWRPTAPSAPTPWNGVVPLWPPYAPDFSAGYSRLRNYNNTLCKLMVVKIRRRRSIF